DGAHHVASGAHKVASGAGSAAAGALHQVDGVWKRTVQVLTTRKAKVDEVAPIAKTSYVYYDDEVYDSVLVEKSTGVTYVTQLLFDASVKKYYVYIRWGEKDYKLDGPHETIESAKDAFQLTYKEKFGLEWATRETTVSEKWTYEVKTYETYEEIEYIEEVVEETEVETILKKEKEIVVEDVVVKTETTTTVTEEEVTVEEVTKEVVVAEETDKEIVKEVTIVKETGSTKPAVSKGTSWFRKIATGVATGVAAGAGAVVAGAGAVKDGAHHVASGAGSAAAGALTKVDGVWKRTVQVLTTRKAHVDKVAPIAKTSYVYYDDEVYDAVLTEKSTGITYVTQLLFDSATHKYFVYIRWGEKDYKLDGPHETIESAKDAFQLTYKEKFGVEWSVRETTVSEHWTYEVKTYETFETVEEIEEIVEEAEAEVIIKKEQQLVIEDVEVKTETVTTVTEEEVVLEHTTEKTEVVVETETEKETIKEIVVESGSTKPAVSKGSSWFRKAVGGVAAGVAVVGAAGVGAVVAGAGAVKDGAHHVASGAHKVASGAGSAAAGALHQVDGVWKRTVQVLTTRKAKVDEVAPIAKTSYVYYDDEVYDSVLVEKSTGVTYVTQLLFDASVKKYYVYIRWGEKDYKLDGPHETIESAKDAFQLTYKEKFGLEWATRETTVSEKWTYEVKTYETYEEIEYIEEVVEETEVETILKKEEQVIVKHEDKEEVVENVTTTTTTTTTTEEEEVVVEKTKDVAVTDGEEIIKIVTTVKETGVVAEPAVSKGTSWFRRIASGAGAVASGALEQVDGVWKRTVQVLTTRKAHVDKVAPIAKTSYVYYDDDVYDAVLTEKSTGITYVTQLLFDSATHKYFVYIRWGEKDYKLDGPYETIESAKAAFLVIYKEKFGVEWSVRETTVSEHWSYEVKTYETFEEVEEVEEIVEDYEVKEIVAREQQVVVDSRVISTEQSVSSSHDDTVTRTTVNEVVTQEGAASGSGAGHGGASGFGGSSSFEYHQTQQETKKSTFNLANLPTLNAGIDADTGAAIGVIDLTSGTAETYRELPQHLRPRAWVSLHVGGWQDAPHDLKGFMRLDDQSGQKLMEHARDESIGTSQESTAIDNLSLPEIVGLFAQKLYGHFGEELPSELSMEKLRDLARGVPSRH
ncbi:hypothetical protein BGZ94_001583, partial [Podila epigama]